MPKPKDTNTEKKIIEVATRLFGQNGFAGTSTREICKKAGVNISLISYYFGGKQELYQKILDTLVGKIINHMTSDLNIKETFDTLEKDKKIEVLIGRIEKMIDYFYSDKITNEELLLLVREQITSSNTLNVMGFQMFKKLLASILEKDENDKEVIFRGLSIIGQINSARIFSQFSLKALNQSGYSKEDIQMLKMIIIGQIKLILDDLKGHDNE